MNIVPTFLLTSTSPKYFGCVFCPDVLFLPWAVSLLDYARFESKQKWTPSSRIWTSDLWISALFPTTVHRSTNWAIEGTCLLSVNARAKANTRRWGVACFLCFINKSKSGWPRGLRRCVQVAVHFCGRGFESHFWQYVFILCRHSTFMVYMFTIHATHPWPHWICWQNVEFLCIKHMLLYILVQAPYSVSCQDGRAV